MSPSEWIACEDPAAMFANLADHVTDRKRLLFAVACCRRAWDRLDDPSKGAVAVAEAYADQRATYQRVMDARKRVLERLQIRRGLVAALELERTNTEERVALGYAAAYVAVDPMQSAELAARAVAAGQTWRAGISLPSQQLLLRQDTAYQQERAAQCNVIRDMFNPWRSTGIDPDALPEPVATLAEQIYSTGDYERLPELGEALSRAGCEDREMLDHCRQPHHVRGCWLMDDLLGRR